MMQHKRSLAAESDRPEKTWRVQVLRQHVFEFRKRYKGKLPSNSSPELEARYAQMQQVLAAAERDLENIGMR